MNAPQQLEAVLAIFEDDGDFTVRVGPQVNAKSISQAVVPLIASLGAKKLLLITPLETKVFKFNGAPAAPPVRSAEPVPRQTRIVQDGGAPPSAEDAAAEFEEYVRKEEEAERVLREMDAASKADPQLTTEEDAPAQKPVRRSNKTPEAQVDNTSACGRCQGHGAIAGGGTCPVCRGKGVIGKWGGRRR
jgi:hypothetical protein